MAAAVLVSATACSAGPSQPVMIDGQFDDWEAEARVSDPAGDAAGPLDLVSVDTRSAGTEVAVLIGYAEEVALFDGPDGEPTLELDVQSASGARLTIDFRGRLAYRNGDREQHVRWSELNFARMPTFASDHYEIRFDTSAIGLVASDRVTLQFSGADTIAHPIEVVLDQSPTVLGVRTTERQADTQFRLAAFNVGSNGLLLPGRPRGQQIGRLVRAVDADVYAFSEVFPYDLSKIDLSVEPDPDNMPATDPGILTRRLEELGLEGGSTGWHAVAGGDVAIASRFDLIPVPSRVSAAAVVRLPSGDSVLVASIHLECCGSFLGSQQDERRVEQVRSLIETLQRFREGALGPELEPYRAAPIIVAGDWNLVGSRMPLTLLEQADGVALTHLLVRHLADTDVSTGKCHPLPEAQQCPREEPGRFPAGMGDLVAYSAGGLMPRNSFALNSAELAPDILAALGLEPFDSHASDHFVVVADFAVR